MSETKTIPKKSVKTQVRYLVIAVIIIALCSVFAYHVERDFGKVDVQEIEIVHPTGKVMVAKLYRPVNATSENPMPAVLALHGYQNDKDTMSGSAIELSRRGFVVLALDELAHGDTGLFVPGFAGDPTLGGDTAYKYLKNLPFVNGEKMGIMGHSMGAGTTFSTAALNPDHDALNPQCGSPGSPEFHNVLLTQALYEEFRGFRENEGRVSGLTNHPNRIEAFGLENGPVSWGETYGSFEEGTARQQVLIHTVHPGVTHSHKAVTAAVDWMRQSLKDGQEDSNWIPSNNHIYMWKEWLTLIALLATLFSMIPLTSIFLKTSYFNVVAQPVPKRYVPSNKKWWILAIINILIAAITYPVLTAKASLMPATLFKLSMGNGIVVWFLGNALIALVLFLIWYKTQGKKNGVTMYDMGVSFDEEKTVINWHIIGKTALLGLILFAWMYIIQGISQWALGIEFRFLWGFMRQFTPGRFPMFLLYLIPYLIFFLINGGIWLFGQARQPEYDSPTRTQVVWWLKNCVAFLGGFLIIWLIQYVPYLFMGMAPGFEAIGLPQFGQMWPLMTMIFIPQFIALLFLHTWFYRKTGKIYLGALMTASIAIWFTAAGSVIM